MIKKRRQIRPLRPTSATEPTVPADDLLSSFPNIAPTSAARLLARVTGKMADIVDDDGAPTAARIRAGKTVGELLLLAAKADQATAESGGDGRVRFAAQLRRGIKSKDFQYGHKPGDAAELAEWNSVLSKPMN